MNNALGGEPALKDEALFLLGGTNVLPVYLHIFSTYTLNLFTQGPQLVFLFLIHLPHLLSHTGSTKSDFLLVISYSYSFYFISSQVLRRLFQESRESNYLQIKLSRMRRSRRYVRTSSLHSYAQMFSHLGFPSIRIYGEIDIDIDIDIWQASVMVICWHTDVMWFHLLHDFMLLLITICGGRLHGQMDYISRTVSHCDCHEKCPLFFLLFPFSFSFPLAPSTDILPPFV